MDSSSDDVASTFPFIQLPKEIRLLVWEATFEPQYILLRFVEGRRPTSNIPVYAFKPYDDPKTPIALQVCRESRKISLQRYRPWNFRWYLHDRVERSKVVMWDTACDTIVLPKQFHKYQLDVLKVSCYFQLKVLKSLAIPTCVWLTDHGSQSPFSVMAVIAQAFPALKELVICLGGETERRTWDLSEMTFHPPSPRLSPSSFFTQNIDQGLDCIRRNFPEWPLSTIKVWESQDDNDMLHGEVFQVTVGPDKQPVYKCWCRPSRWDTSIHDRHAPEGWYHKRLRSFGQEIDSGKARTSIKETPQPVIVWRRPRYGNRMHFTNRYKVSGNSDVKVF